MSNNDICSRVFLCVPMCTGMLYALYQKTKLSYEEEHILCEF
jgi:hypothetical protein